MCRNSLSTAWLRTSSCIVTVRDSLYCSRRSCLVEGERGQWMVSIWLSQNEKTGVRESCGAGIIEPFYWLSCLRVAGTMRCRNQSLFAAARLQSVSPLFEHASTACPSICLSVCLIGLCLGIRNPRQFAVATAIIDSMLKTL